jgi:hypothetical protein
MIAGLDVPDICKVQGCKEPAQIYSKKTMNSNGKNTYLKTCCRHNYKDLEAEKVKK